MHRRIGVLLISVTPLLFADVTLRYNMDFKMGVSLPAGAGPQMPSGPSVLRIKGNKTQSTMGKYMVIGDLATNQTTWIDTENMKLASGSVEDFFKALANASAARMPNISPQAKGIAQMFQGDAQTRKTGRTETIQGIRAQETELVYSVNINQPLPNVPAGGPAMRMIMQIWRADADEVARSPALAELARYNIASSGLSGFDVSGFMHQLIVGFDQGLNGLQDALQDLMKQPGMQLRMHIEGYSAMLAAVAPQLQTQGQALPDGVKPSQPFISMTSELVELSTAPIDDSVFQIPSGYRRVGVKEIVEDQLAAVGADAKAVERRNLTPPTPLDPNLIVPSGAGVGGGAYRIGGPVYAPVPVYQPEPKYTEEARKARLQGTVRLSLVVDVSGKPVGIKVTKSLGLDLDQKAIEAVQQWWFKPGMKEGKPVPVIATMEVNFRLLDDPNK